MYKIDSSKKSPPPKYYSESFKMMVVSEVEKGFSKDSLKRKYNIGGKTTVLEWCRKYGKLHNPVVKYEVKLKSDVDKQIQLKRRVADLERALSDAHLKICSQDVLIDLAENNYNIAIRKNFGAKQLK
ncbi:MAG: hypothetical protein NTW25_01235 [Candidatus Kapabacteria bacterium]|nr:hypothetical protein [Candidatus Kapabacteria bacterium]